MSDDVNGNLNTINEKLSFIDDSIAKKVNDSINESILNIRDSIINALKDENSVLKKRVDDLEEKTKRLEISKNDLDQYSRHNIIEIPGIPASVTDDLLQGKVTDILKSIDVKDVKNDFEDCHRMGKANPKVTIIRFVNRKYCREALTNRASLRTTDKEELGFNATTKLFLNENLTPLNIRIAWKCRKLKKAAKIQRVSESKGIIKIRRSMNETPIRIEHDSVLAELFPGFQFDENAG